MKPRRRSALLRGSVALLLLTVTMTTPLGYSLSHPASTSASSTSLHPSCAQGWTLCTEVYNSERVFGEGVYVGHDEPSTLFYSARPGSGNRMAYYLRLPTDPPVAPPAGTYNFQLHPAFWFGMAMCDTQSYPEQLRTCTPDSDGNIVDPAVSPKHPGGAFMEMQFYPPGWAPFNLPGGISCDATRWCAALNIDSLSQDPVNNTQLNDACAAKVGLEYVNFAFVTRDGHAQAPANPVDATSATFTPDPTRDLFMNSGDQISVVMHDTQHGLQIVIADITTHQAGSMTASAANGFGQVLYAPNPSTACTNLPYDFHPMYSTSSEETRVPWTAHSYNIAFADEIGHFDYCSAIDPSTSTCTGNEGVTGDVEPADADDNFCLPASASLSVAISGCPGTNGGFDGTSYQPDWPDGDTQHHPTSILFGSPLTGPLYNVNYERMAFEADLPRVEFNDISTASQTCNSLTGNYCTLIPLTDDNTPATFYPFFTAAQVGNHCVWTLGNDIPNLTTYDFGKNNEYGTLLRLAYTNGGGVVRQFEDFRQVFAPIPCTLTAPFARPIRTP